MYQCLSRVVHLTRVDHVGSSLMRVWEPQIQPRRKPHDYIVGFLSMRVYCGLDSRYGESWIAVSLNDNREVRYRLSRCRSRIGHVKVMLIYCRFVVKLHKDI